MNITNKKNPSLFTYSLSSTPLEVVKSWTYLGAVIDHKLTWNEHCDHVRKKALASLGLIQRTLHAALRECKELAYKLLVCPRLEYASAAWSPQAAGNKLKLEKV